MTLVVPNVCQGLINPRFTPADLVRVSQTILTVKVTPGADGRCVVGVGETLKGEVPKGLGLRVGEDAAEAFAEAIRNGAAGVLFLAGDLSAAGDVTTEEKPAGALNLGGGWWGIYAGKDGVHAVKNDQQDLKTVWAGATDMLEAAVRYAVADAGRASFPVAVGVKWRGETLAAKAENVSGLRAVEMEADPAPVLHVGSGSGDRLLAREGDAFKDVAGDRGLGAKSKMAVWTDLDADGRLDLASWDGARVTAWVQAKDGRFSAKGSLDLPSCTGMAAAPGGAPARAAVAAARTDGVILIGVDAQGLVAVGTLALPDGAGPKLGAGGPLVVADLDGDGLVDLAQVFENGLVAWPGTAAGNYPAGRVAMEGSLGKELTAADAGDFDGDGRLDIVVGGKRGAGEATGINLLANRGDWRFAPVWLEAGEIYKTQTRARTVQVCDINCDGRADLFVGYERSGPVFLFNRGFRTFGTADELTLAGATVGEGDAARELQCGTALMGGAPRGVVADFDRDGAPDLASAAPDGTVWVVWRDRGERYLNVEAALPRGAAGPMTVNAWHGARSLGARLARPGMPAYFGMESKGGLKLEWTGADGKPRTRTVPVIKALTRVELAD
jgi:hypothetical protein